MTQLNITGLVTNTDGASSPFSGTIEVIQPPIIDSVTVIPQSAPAGTLRTITITAHDPAGLPLGYTCLVDGKAATTTFSPHIFTMFV